ncbi:MAG: hypothetical protein U0930_13110 [Pirellulales bacterium]
MMCHELLIDDPTASILKRLDLNPNHLRWCRSKDTRAGYRDEPKTAERLKTTES